MSPSIMPKRCSRSSGDRIWRAMTEAAKFGACFVTVAMTRSAKASFSRGSAHERSPGSFGATCCTNRLRDVLACRRQRGIERRGNEHLDHGLARPAVEPGVEIGALEIIERRADDDAGAVMVHAAPCRAAR